MPYKKLPYLARIFKILVCSGGTPTRLKWSKPEQWWLILLTGKGWDGLQTTNLKNKKKQKKIKITTSKWTNRDTAPLNRFFSFFSKSAWQRIHTINKYSSGLHYTKVFLYNIYTINIWDYNCYSTLTHKIRTLHFCKMSIFSK